MNRSVNTSPIRRPTNGAAREREKARRKKRVRNRIIILLVISALAVYGIVACSRAGASTISFAAPASGEIRQDKPLEELADYPAFAGQAGISSRCAILCDLTDGRVICEKNAAEKVKIASLTKIMTAIVAIENLPDMRETYTMSGRVIKTLKAENSSVAGFVEGETVTAYDLLYAAMLPSGGDGAMGLAELVGGSQEGFVDMMNAKAAELGMNRTHFTNATGLDDDGNYSCAYDVSLLFEYALKNDTFRQVVTTSHYTSNPTPQHPNGINMVSTVYDGFSENGLDMGAVVGGKTGFTGAAGRCLATYAVKDGKEYILITLGASRTPEHFKDAFALYYEFLGDS